MKRELTVDHTFAGASEISQRIIAIGMVPALLDGNAQRKNILGADVPGISKGVIASMVIAGVAAIGAEVVAYVTGAERSVPVMALAVLAIALSGRDTLRKGWIALKNLTLNINLLMTVAVIGAVLIGQWPEAAMVIWLFSVAELIERLSLDRARNAIRSLIALAPEVANVEVQGRFVETPWSFTATWHCIWI